MIGMDSIGPFPKTKNGNRYILVAVDHFKKWIEAEAVRDTTAEHAVNFIRTKLVKRHGTPKRLLTGRGSYFMSREFETALTSYGKDHATTSVNHPQAKRTHAG
ncbi:hypothetical protein MTO96_017120 [Rhipicephalus appendiculatus]